MDLNPIFCSFDFLRRPTLLRLRTRESNYAANERNGSAPKISPLFQEGLSDAAGLPSRHLISNTDFI